MQTLHTTNTQDTELAKIGFTIDFVTPNCKCFKRGTERLFALAEGDEWLFFQTKTNELLLRRTNKTFKEMYNKLVDVRKQTATLLELGFILMRDTFEIRYYENQTPEFTHCFTINEKYGNSDFNACGNYHRKQNDGTITDVSTDVKFVFHFGLKNKMAQ